jgi:hypothetical protein
MLQLFAGLSLIVSARPSCLTCPPTHPRTSSEVTTCTLKPSACSSLSNEFSITISPAGPPCKFTKLPKTLMRHMGGLLNLGRFLCNCSSQDSGGYPDLSLKASYTSSLRPHALVGGIRISPAGPPCKFTFMTAFVWNIYI